MNHDAQERALEIWRRYIGEGEHFINASREYQHEELDAHRIAVIPSVLSALTAYRSSGIDLAEFKTKVDSINKRNRLWGFKGMTGQMFFNLLTKFGEVTGVLRELDVLLKETLPLPKNVATASEAIDRFAAFVSELATHAADRRGAPKAGSTVFFLSYFWQIQSPDQYPVYYRSMTGVLQERNLWAPTDELGASYKSFFEFNHILVQLFAAAANRAVTLWDVEHAFWYASQPGSPTKEPSQPPKPGPGPNKPEPATGLPESYLPPVVSILPRLAANDPVLEELCRASGSSIEKVFESRLDTLFRMLGYETEALGQGRGRVPDGIAVCREFRYAIVYDAKVRQQPYAMGTDERAIREYIAATSERLKKQGVQRLYFMVVSSAFSGDHGEVIRSLKMETEAREILLVEAAALLVLLEAKLRDPSITLGPEGIQPLFAESGIITEADAREFQGI